MSLGWGIVGPGRVADKSMAPAITSDPNSWLVGVVGTDKGRADAFAARHGAQWAGTDYRTMLSDPNIDAVLITTPNAFHHDQVIAAAAAGKHILCDKPLALNVAGARDAVEACSDAKVKLGINFQTRFHECFQVARRVIERGEIGDIVSIQIDASPGATPLGGWRADADLAGLGAVNNIAVHIYDVLRYLLDDEVMEVVAMFDTGRSGELERIPMVLLRFTAGVLAYANGNQVTTYPFNDLVINGTKGRIDGRGLTRPLLEGDMRVLSEAGETTAHFSAADCYERSVAAFSTSVLAGRDPQPSGVDGLRSVELTDAIARSARLGQVISLAS